MPTQFPTRTALALTTAVALLAAYRLLDPTKGLSPAIFPEAARVTLLRQSPPATRLPNGVQQTDVNKSGPPNAAPPPHVGSSARRPPVSPYLIDESGSLDAFFSQLHLLEDIRRPNTLLDMPLPIVTVLHYGDSPTTADLITGDIRDLLQQRFGDAGRGFLLTAKPWAWYQHRGVDLTDKNWQTSTAVGKGRAEIYGIGGAAFTGDASASSHITLKDADQASIELSYEAQPTGGSLSISANGTPVQTISTAADSPGPAWHTTSLPPGTKTIDLKPTAGTVKLFGETLLTGRPGILYDSLGLNGASTSVLSNGFNAEAWQAELLHAQPILVVINYGTNESGFGAYVDKQYEPTLRTAIARIRAALPNTSILIMSPMDRGRRSGVDQIETYDTIPRIVAIQRRVAAELNCAFFDTFNAMGGDGTMSRWYTGHPRLVAGDLIHPTPQGAAIVAHLLIHDLALAYDHSHDNDHSHGNDRSLGNAPQPPAHVAVAPPPAPAATPTLTPHVPSKQKPSAAGTPLPTTRPISEPAAPPAQPPTPEPPQP